MTAVKISACDNELYMIASNAIGPLQATGSSELIHIKSGFANPVTDNFVLESILPKGTWQITMIGINWGGAWAFKIAIGSDTYASSGASGEVGVVWHKTTPAMKIG